MIVSTTDTIAGKRIVKVLGTVHTKEPVFGTRSVSPELAQKNLEKQAEKSAANAIMGLRIEERQRTKWIRGLPRRYYAYGTAVVVE